MLLGAIEIAIILALSITMIVTVGPHNDFRVFTPIYSVESSIGGLTGIFQGMVFAFLAFVGFETAAPLGEETHNPKRNIPRAVIYSAIAIGLLYMFLIPPWQGPDEPSHFAHIALLDRYGLDEGAVAGIRKRGAVATPLGPSAGKSSIATTSTTGAEPSPAGSGLGASTCPFDPSPSVAT